jgi:hypothetical protein
MEQRPTPEFFSGAAIAALCGLLFGLLLHTPWEKHPGGPQILFGSAQAAEPSRPAPREDAADSGPSAPTEVANPDTGYVRPDPLPVTRLAPQMFDVQPAAAEEAERRNVDEVVDEGAPQPSPRDPG